MTVKEAHQYKYWTEARDRTQVGVQRCWCSPSIFWFFKCLGYKKKNAILEEPTLHMAEKGKRWTCFLAKFDTLGWFLSSLFL